MGKHPPVRQGIKDVSIHQALRKGEGPANALVRGCLGTDRDARHTINVRRHVHEDEQAVASQGYHPHRGGRRDSSEDRSPSPESPAAVDEEYWTMHFDGSPMKQGAALGLVFVSPLGVRMMYVIRISFPASNNVAEYEALINGLRITIELGIRRLDVRGNSRLVADQVMKESNCLNPKMAAYYQKSDNWRISSMASSSNTSSDDSTRQPTRWQKWHRAASPSRLASLPATSINSRSTTRSRGIQGRAARLRLGGWSTADPAPPRGHGA
jgi:ribonuclease HI